jgi:hypothetical protein
MPNAIDQSNMVRRLPVKGRRLPGENRPTDF